MDNKMQSSKRKTEITQQPRKKLYSLRSLTSHDLPSSYTAQKTPFDQLQKSLNRDNNMEEQPVAQPVATIPGFEDEVIEGKLWSYFLAKVQSVSGKVEKQQVNYRQKHFWLIKQQISSLQNTYSNQSAQLENIIKEKYKQVHQIFEEIKQERLMKPYTLSPKGKKAKKEQPIMDNSEKLVSLKEHVQLIRSDVLKLQIQLGKINQDSAKLKLEWVTFLKKILKGGFYLKDGNQTVFRQMIEAGVVLQADDMPDILDETSKKCLLQLYDHLKKDGKKAVRATPLQFQRSRILSQARQSLGQIARKNLVRQVYKDTQNFMANLVKQSDWRTTNIVLPRIKTVRKEDGSSWKQHERKRIGYAYSGEDLIKVRGILFGWKVQSTQ